jgi:hypothetical protein
MSDTHLTTGVLATELGVPVWRVRRVVDALGVRCPRAGQYRLIPRALIPSIRAALEEQAATAGEAPRA